MGCIRLLVGSTGKEANSAPLELVYGLSFAIIFKKKKYVDRETVPKEGRGVVPFPYKKYS